MIAILKLVEYIMVRSGFSILAIFITEGMDCYE